ncbi:hypothetical protein P3L10_034521 [Capsicum annuum]
MAHASVASLMRTIESLLTSNSPMRSLICDHREELCALREKVRISNIWTRRKFRKSLQQLEKDIDHVWKESTKIQDKGKQVSEESLVHDFSSSTNDILNVKSNMVGRVLGLSYNHLTSDLKECLLHFGIFPEDSEIPVKNLMRSWMAEGFLKLENDLEGEAEKCLQEPVDRCLVLVCKKSLDGTKIRSCKVHDLIQDMCILSLIWLRYISLFIDRKLDMPPEICRLWNQQTFIVQGTSGTFPKEIWGLMQLRHLKLPQFYLPNPPSVSADKGSHMGLLIWTWVILTS